MVERELREVGALLQQGLDVPDFAPVAARGRVIRRRRRAAVGAGAALAIALVTVGLAQQLPSQRSLGPVERPHHPAPNGAHRVLSDPGAQVDVHRSVVNGRGDVLSVVVVPQRTFGVEDSCHVGVPSAFRWVGSNGETVDWSDASASRPVRAVRGGFAVGPVPEQCRTGTDGERDGYLVDRDGNQRTAPSRTAATPDPPPGAALLPVSPDDLLWAHSRTGRRLYWSGDGTSWKQHETSLPRGENVSVTVAGDRAAFTTNRLVESTDDGGRSWRTDDLSAALRPIRIADVRWTITRGGNLIGVTTLVGRGDVVFHSTDPSWSAFRTSDVSTDFGRVDPQVVGGTVYAADTDGWLLSDDDGVSWRRVSPLG